MFLAHQSEVPNLEMNVLSAQIGTVLKSGVGLGRELIFGF